MPSQITCSDSLESFHKREAPKYSIPPGCAASYFPEANVLVPVTSVADKSNTPTSKQVIVPSVGLSVGLVTDRLVCAFSVR